MRRLFISVGVFLLISCPSRAMAGQPFDFIDEATPPDVSAALKAVYEGRGSQAACDDASTATAVLFARYREGIITSDFALASRCAEMLLAAGAGVQELGPAVVAAIEQLSGGKLAFLRRVADASPAPFEQAADCDLPVGSKPFLVPISLQGRCLAAVLDTGANVVVMPRDLTRDRSGVSLGPIYAIDGLSAFGAPLSVVVAYDPTELQQEQLAAEGADLLLGASALYHTPVVVGPKGIRLAAGPVPPSDYEVVDLTYDGHAYVAAKIGGSVWQCLIDTGTTSSLLPPREATTMTGVRPVRTMDGIVPFGVAQDEDAFLDDVAFSLVKPSVRLDHRQDEPECIIGYDDLARRGAIIDLKARTLSLRPPGR